MSCHRFCFVVSGNCFIFVGTDPHTTHMAYCTPLRHSPACEPVRHLVVAKSGKSEAYQSHEQSFTFDSEVNRYQWFTEIHFNDAEKILIESPHREWALEWREQYDIALKNADWNWAKRSMIGNGAAKAKNTYVMGVDVDEAPEVLCKKFLQVLNKSGIMFETRRGEVGYNFSPMSGYFYRDEDGDLLIKLFCDCTFTKP